MPNSFTTKLDAEKFLADDEDLDKLSTAKLVDIWGWINDSDRLHRLMPSDNLKPHKPEVIDKIRMKALSDLEKLRLNE